LISEKNSDRELFESYPNHASLTERGQNCPRGERDCFMYQLLGSNFFEHIFQNFLMFPLSSFFASNFKHK
jgi:hypothetical protein